MEEKYLYLEHDLKIRLRTKNQWKKYFLKNIKDYENFEDWFFDMEKRYYLIKKI